MTGRCKENRARLFSVVPSDRRRDGGHNLKHRRLPLNIKKCFIPVEGVRLWDRLPKWAVEFSNLRTTNTERGLAPAHSNSEKN